MKNELTMRGRSFINLKDGEGKESGWRSIDNFEVGVVTLFTLSNEDVSNAVKLVDIEKKYGLTYDYFYFKCPFEMKFKLYTLKYYAGLNIAQILNILANNSQYNLEQMNSSEILQVYCGVSVKDAENRIKLVDKLNKQYDDKKTQLFSKF